VSRLSAASNSPLQLTMYRSWGGKRAPSNKTSVVNDDPSVVLVKLKKGTLVEPLAFHGCTGEVLRSESSFFAVYSGFRGGSVVMRCLEAGLPENGVVGVDVGRSVQEREAAEVTSEEDE
jgi:hypothetical protein